MMSPCKVVVTNMAKDQRKICFALCYADMLYMT